MPPLTRRKGDLPQFGYSGQELPALPPSLPQPSSTLCWQAPAQGCPLSAQQPSTFPGRQHQEPLLSIISNIRMKESTQCNLRFLFLCWRELQDRFLRLEQPSLRTQMKQESTLLLKDKYTKQAQLPSQSALGTDRQHWRQMSSASDRVPGSKPAAQTALCSSKLDHLKTILQNRQWS